MIETYLLYIYILIFAGFFAYIAQYDKNAMPRMLGRILCFMFLFVPAALRYGIGTDYKHYVRIYENNFPDDMQKLEPGFVFIGRVCHFIGLSPEMFIAVIAGITIALICFYIPRNHIFTVVVFYILSFIYLNSYNLSRQCLATSLLLCGFSLFYNNQKIKAFLLFVFAILIHYSSVVALPIVAISFVKMNSFLRFGLIVLVFIIGINEKFMLMLIDVAALINPRNARLTLLLTKTEINVGITNIIMALPSALILLNSKKILRQNNGTLIVNANAFFLILLTMSYLMAILSRFITVLFFIPLFSIQILYNANRRYAQLCHLFLIGCFIMLFLRYIEHHSVTKSQSFGIGFGISPYISIFNK
ncbi:MAG: EpsG family protein [Chitinispirillales bacterium]|jgi:hypothetical protein|nr:EpsG family protein [Chitinispirillales bacterium]